MLRNAKRLLLLFALLLVVVLSVVLVLENPQRIHLVFLGWSSVELPLPVLLAAAFISGVLACLCFCIWSLSRLRLRIARQQQELRRLRDQLPPAS